MMLVALVVMVGSSLQWSIRESWREVDCHTGPEWSVAQIEWCLVQSVVTAELTC